MPRALLRLLRRRPADSETLPVPSAWTYELQGQTLTVRLDPVAVAGGTAARLSVTATARDSRLLLRTLLVTRATLVLEDGVQLNVLGRTDAGEAPTRAWVDDHLAGMGDALVTPRPAPPAISTTWWTRRANFGDLLGPVMVHRITGRPVVHSSHALTERRPLVTVGSVLTFSDVWGSQVWGSGLIQPLRDRDLTRMRDREAPRIHAVRGRRTAAELRSRLGWHVPDVFGDPALLAPRFLAPSGDAPGLGPVVVPHGMHATLFKERPELLGGLTWVDPSQGPQPVIEQIASASHCLSSSLHGVIVAQAFGVPWTWLRVTDVPLLGDEFKFEDFFTGLAGEVARLDVQRATLSPQLLAEGIRRARVPADRHDLDRLEAAFPDLS